MKHPAKHTVVVVDDDPLILSLFGSVLQVQGFNPVLFDSAVAAVDFLRRAEAAAILVDLILPEMSGLDLLRHVAAHKPHIPVIVVTGVSQLDTAVECMKLGAVDYLTKPVAVGRLAESLTRALKLRGAQGEDAGEPVQQGNRLLPEDEPSARYRSSPGVPERIAKAVAYIEQNLSRPLYLEGIAQQACLSKFHFCREFRKYFGITPMQFVLRRRVAQAAELLQARELPVSQVSMQCGFSDQSEFTKWFKKATGLTPSCYRASKGGLSPLTHHKEQ